MSHPGHKIQPGDVVSLDRSHFDTVLYDSPDSWDTVGERISYRELLLVLATTKSWDRIMVMTPDFRLGWASGWIFTRRSRR